MLPVINIGPLALPAPELILLLGFWLGADIAEKHASRFRVNPTEIFYLILTAVLAGLAGARIVYAAQALAAFRESPLNLLALRPEMLDTNGGILAALLAGLTFIRVKHLPLWPTLDAVTSLLTVLGVTLGLAHLASGDAFGAPARIPWAIQLWGEQRHPSQVYETLAALAVGAALWPGTRIAQWSLDPGREGLRFWTFLAFSAMACIFLEAFRGDSLLVLNSFRQAQLSGWLILAISLWQIGRHIPTQDLIKPQAPP
jgi:phosphatidylglycerol:prolipoprotein diacylglycerol transferase